MCGVWLPSLGQIFVWRVLSNPLFLMLTFSVVTTRTAMRAFGMLVPAFGESLGMGREESTYLLTIMSVADFLSRWSLFHYIPGSSPLLSSTCCCPASRRNGSS